MTGGSFFSEVVQRLGTSKILTLCGNSRGTELRGIPCLEGASSNKLFQEKNYFEFPYLGNRFERDDDVQGVPIPLPPLHSRTGQ